MTSSYAPFSSAELPAEAESQAPAEMRPPLAAQNSWRCQFAINGRFYSQATTGVQRYGREITSALDSLLSRSQGRGSLFAASNARHVPKFASVDVSIGGGGRGHVWEQLAFPLRSDMATLNLCNTGPIAGSGHVICIHDANIFLEPDSYSTPFRLFYRALLPRLAARAARLTSVSQASCIQLAARLPVALKDFVVIPNGHEHVFRWNASSSALWTSMADARPFVLLQGSRARHKNAELILRQADALDELGLDLIVAGGVANIFSKISNIRRPNIRCLGVVSDDDLACLYSRAVCLAFPSRSEGFGLPIIEAMALGCPVVSSDRASMPEVCGSAALMASPQDPAAWRKHFTALAQSADLRADLRGRGKERVRRFSWLESARAYLSIFGHSP